MVVILGADHGGFELKNAIISHLEKKGMAWVDAGCFSPDSCDYPDFAFIVSEQVAKSKGKDVGILLCRSGAGMYIAANKVKGIRAGEALTVKGAKLLREHNDTNVLTLAGDLLSKKETLKIVDAWLSTPRVSEDRHKRRVAKIEKYEKTH